MKKTFLFALTCAMSATSFAQWNNTGDSKTTGSLTLGSSANPTTAIEIQGKVVPWQDSQDEIVPVGPTNGAKEIRFLSEGGGNRSTIMSSSGGGWGGDFLFLTGTDWNKQLKRLHIHPYGQTYLFDKVIHLGGNGSNQTSKGEGSRLFFGGTQEHHGGAYITRYAHSAIQHDMRMSMGRSELNRIVLGSDGTDGIAFKNLLAIEANGNVAIGLNDSQRAVHKLEVNGTIRAKEIRVESGWADFVFHKDYQLPTLQEVKAHIDEHKHLPGMPSEAEVKENGVGLADATTKLLQKVEELTLYAIQQQEKIDALSNEIKELKNDKK